MGKEIVLYYMTMDKVSTKIVVQGKKVFFENYTDDFIDRAFGNYESPVSLKRFEELLEERCFPRTRGNAKEVLKSLGLDTYNVYEIVKRTHGAMFDDTYWFKFEGEDLTYKELKKSLGIWFWD